MTNAKDIHAIMPNIYIQSRVEFNFLSKLLRGFYIYNDE